MARWIRGSPAWKRAERRMRLMPLVERALLFAAGLALLGALLWVYTSP